MAEVREWLQLSKDENPGDHNWWGWDLDVGPSGVLSGEPSG